MADMWKKSPQEQFRVALFESGPIEPKHRVPASLTGDWSPDMASAADRRFFSDFDLFGERINRFYTPDRSWGGGPWRAQEMAETLLTRHEDPSFGRRYRMFFNQAPIGVIEVSAFLDYDPAKPEVVTYAMLEHVHLLPYGDVAGFLVFLAQNTACADEKEYSNSQRTIDRVLLASLWEANRNDNDGEVELFLQGSAKHYLEWRSLVLRNRAAPASN